MHDIHTPATQMAYIYQSVHHADSKRKDSNDTFNSTSPTFSPQECECTFCTTDTGAVRMKENFMCATVCALFVEIFINKTATCIDKNCLENDTIL